MVVAAAVLILTSCGSDGSSSADSVDSVPATSTVAPDPTPLPEPAAAGGEGELPANLVEFQECVAEGGLQAEFAFGDQGEVIAIDITGEVTNEVMGQLEGACGQFLADYDGELNLPATSSGSASGDAAGADGEPPANLLEFRECVADGGLAVEFSYNASGEVVVIDITGEVSEELFEQLDPCGSFLGDYDGELNLPEPPLEDLIDESVVPAPASTCPDEMADYEVCTLVPGAGFGLDGVAMLTDGDLAVANYGNQQAGTVIYRVSTAGEVSVFSSGEERPLNLVQGPDGSVVVGRRLTDLVLIDDSGTETVVHTVEAGRGVDPLGTDASGALYFAVQSPQFNDGTRIDRLTPAGELTTVFDNDGLPWGPAGVAEDGTVFIGSEDQVFRVDADGAVTTLAEIPEAMGDGTDITQGGFGGIVVTPGRIYLTSFFARGVYAVGLDGNYELIAGGNLDPAADGVGTDASFHTPNRLAYDPLTNRLFMTDYEDSSIRVIQLPTS